MRQLSKDVKNEDLLARDRSKLKNTIKKCRKGIKRINKFKKKNLER